MCQPTEAANMERSQEQGGFSRSRCAGRKSARVMLGIRWRQMKRFWRTIEWLLALAWPIVAYNVVFGRYGWSSQYYNRWSECWFALVFLVPMVGPLLFKLFSAMAGRDDAVKRAAFVAMLVLGVALAVAFRPTFGGATFMGFFVPMALHG